MQEKSHCLSILLLFFEKRGVVMYDNIQSFKKEVGGKSLAPFGWVGGKSKLSPWLVGLIPPHAQYIEVFGGALNLLWSKKPSKLEVVNDIDSELVNLYRTIKNYPASLNDKLNELLCSRELVDLVKTKQITHRHTNNIERAALSYFIITASFSGKRLHFGRNKLSPSGSSRHGHIGRLYRDFTVWSKRLKSVQIEHLEFEKMLLDYDHTESFFYLDPPYYDCEHYYINHTFGKQSHQRLAEILKSLKGKWLLSYNNHPAIRELYRDYQIVATPEILYSLNGFGKTKRVSEIVISNYDLKPYL